MTKDKTFTDVMTKPDENEQGEVWLSVMELANMFEEKLGYQRSTVTEGILKAMLNLAFRGLDEQYFRQENETRRFLMLAVERCQHHLDQCMSYREQWDREAVYGKDMLNIRDARNYGWKENPEEKDTKH